MPSVGTPAATTTTTLIAQEATKCDNRLRLPGDVPFALPQVVYSLNASLSQLEAEQLEKCTRAQSKSDIWNNERKRRLTASKFGHVCRKMTNIDKYPNKEITPESVSAIYTPKSFTSRFTSYGISSECLALEEYCKATGNHVHPCGLVVNPAMPFLGASPDGLVCNGLTMGIIEVKCPYLARDMTPAEATGQLKKFCLELSPATGELELQQNHDYYHQVQGQLMVTGADFCDFVVYTSKGLNIQRIVPCQQFMEDMFMQLYRFHHGYGALIL